MIHASLFSGEGGFDLAAEWMGWENAFHCEINPFCQTILKYYWPNATTYSDITKTDFTTWRGKIDILTGGFPCQPFSVAGKQAGTDDPRHLWPQMLRAIREVKPKWVVGENVRGLVSWNGGLVFEQVWADLEAENYKVIPILLPACGIGAPHRRERVWFIAYSNSNKCQSRGEQYKQLWEASTAYGGDESTAYGGDESTTSSIGVRCTSSDGETRRNETDFNGFNTESEQERNNLKHGFGIHSNVPNTFSLGLRRESNRFGKAGKFDKNGSENYWQNFPTQSPICIGDDGLSTRLEFASVFKGVKRPREANTFSRWRSESIKAHGNAIVPQVVYQIFKTIDLFKLLYD